MLATYTAQDGIQRAIVKTFDGNHPCEICKFVREGKQVEKKSPALETLKKLDPMILTTVEIFVDPNRSRPTLPVAPSYESPSYSPPRPPPDLS